MKIFIVHDSLTLRQRLVDMLAELAEIKIIGEAEDKRKAIDSIRRLKPGVVILD